MEKRACEKSNPLTAIFSGKISFLRPKKVPFGAEKPQSPEIEENRNIRKLTFKDLFIDKIEKN